MPNLIPRTGIISAASQYFPVDDKCKLYLDLGDGLQSPADHSSYGNDGIITGATFTNLDAVNCLHIDGSDDVLTIPHDDSLNFTNNFSIHTWINLSAYPANYGTIIAKHYTNWSLYQRFNSKLYPYIHGIEYQDENSLLFQLNTWYQLTQIFNNTDNTITWYINGTLDVQITNVTQTLAPNTIPVLIGHDTYWPLHFHIGQILLFNDDMTTQVPDFFDFTKPRYNI